MTTLCIYLFIHRTSIFCTIWTCKLVMTTKGFKIYIEKHSTFVSDSVIDWHNKTKRSDKVVSTLKYSLSDDFKYKKNIYEISTLNKIFVFYFYVFFFALFLSQIQFVLQCLTQINSSRLINRFTVGVLITTTNLITK